jgi:drug/metabolite transporter (DMT)-like permease
LSLLYRILLLGVLGYENITQNLILGFEDDIYNWKTRKIYIFLMSIFHVFGRASRFSGQLCGYKGIEYSSPTLASAMSNLTPAFTFILAVVKTLFS